MAVALDTSLVFQKFCTLRQEENDQSGQNVLAVDQWRYSTVHCMFDPDASDLGEDLFVPLIKMQTD